MTQQYRISIGVSLEILICSHHLMHSAKRGRNQASMLKCRVQHDWKKLYRPTDLEANAITCQPPADEDSIVFLLIFRFKSSFFVIV